jgi:hypothetical protein
MMRKSLALFAIVYFALASLATAQRDTNRWLDFGQIDLDPRGERVEIPIRQQRPVEALVLGVDNAAVRILDAKIQFGNGQVMNWPIRGVMYPGQRTHVFPFPTRSERRIRNIVLYYETGHSGRHARGERFRSLDRDLDQGPFGNDPKVEQPQEAPDWNRDFDRSWDRDWDRYYRRWRPRISIWARD